MELCLVGHHEKDYSRCIELLSSSLNQSIRSKRNSPVLRNLMQLALSALQKSRLDSNRKIASSGNKTLHKVFNSRRPVLSLLDTNLATFSPILWNMLDALLLISLPSDS